MTSTSNAGSVENAGLAPQSLPRLNPRQIATMLLPGTTVAVMDATDAQFQKDIADQVGIPADTIGWSFDDRVRLINYCRQHLGFDPCASPNKSSAQAVETLPDAELIEGREQSPPAGSGLLTWGMYEDAIDMTKQQFPDWKPE